MDKRWLEKCVRDGCAIEPLLDRKTVVGLAFCCGGETRYVPIQDVTLDDLSDLCSMKKPLVCFDVRNLDKFLLQPKTVHDVKLLYGGDVDCDWLAKKNAAVAEIEKKLNVNIRAAKSAGIDVASHPICDVVPQWLLEAAVCARAAALVELRDKAAQDDPIAFRDHEGRIVEFANVLHDIERNGIRVDVAYAIEELKEEQQPAAKSCFSYIVKNEVDGYVYTKFNPIGGKTGRIKVEDGFNCMGIPHGPARNAFVSRFDGGEIATLDFNAIDYRCIVQTVGGELAAEYAGSQDFHNKTTSFLFGDEVTDLRRSIVKTVTYVYIYGGSRDTLRLKTQLSDEKIAEVIERLDKHLYPIKEFRKELYEKSLSDGYVSLPDNKRVKLVGEEDLHEGKVLGLYAQGFSSHVFESALIEADEAMRGKKSKLLFTVHDELVVDVCKEERTVLATLKDVMETAVPGHEFVVKVKEGRSYGEIV